MRTKILALENMLSTDYNTLPYHKCINLRLVLMDRIKPNGYHDCYIILIFFLGFYFYVQHLFNVLMFL